MRFGVEAGFGPRLIDFPRLCSISEPVDVLDTMWQLEREADRGDIIPVGTAGGIHGGSWSLH